MLKSSIEREEVTQDIVAPKKKVVQPPVVDKEYQKPVSKKLSGPPKI